MHDIIDAEVNSLIEELEFKRKALHDHVDKISKTIPEDSWIKVGETIYGVCGMPTNGRVRVITCLVEDAGRVVLWNSNLKPICEQNDIKVKVLSIEVKSLQGYNFAGNQWIIDKAKVGDNLKFGSYSPKGRSVPWKKQEWYDANFGESQHE